MIADDKAAHEESDDGSDCDGGSWLSPREWAGAKQVHADLTRVQAELVEARRDLEVEQKLSVRGTKLLDMDAQAWMERQQHHTREKDAWTLKLSTARHGWTTQQLAFSRTSSGERFSLCHYRDVFLGVLYAGVCAHLQSKRPIHHPLFFSARVTSE
jgi:hypothetical protein